MRPFLVALLFLIRFPLVQANCWKDGIKFDPFCAMNYYGAGDELVYEKGHHRQKRSLFSSPCSPGWTGHFCESPLCYDRSDPLTPYESEMDKVIDTLHLPENCAGNVFVPMDSSSEKIVVSVTTDAGRPIVNFTDQNGKQQETTEQTGGDGFGKAIFSIAPGPYIMTVELGGVPTRTCIAHIEAKSKVTFDAGFVGGPHGDRPPFGESAEENVPSYFVAHTFFIESPAEVRTVTIRRIEYAQPIYRALLQRRYDCAYEFYAGEFTCTAGHQYIYTIDGVDARGFAFRRSRPFSCFGTVPTEQPPVTREPVSDCHNGGTFVNRTGSPFCFCRELFTGRQCEQVLCMNGGLPITSDPNLCDCPDGYVGRGCENIICDPNVGKILTDEKQLIVVVRDTKSVAAAIPAIVQAIKDEYECHTVEGRSVYNGFMLITFSNGEYSSVSYDRDSYSLFGADLSSIAQSTTIGRCTDNVLTALRIAFIQNENAKSPIFLFTDVVPDETELPVWSHVLELNAVRKFQIHPVFLDTSTACPFSESDRRFKVLESLAVYSGGLVHTPSTHALRELLAHAIRTTTYRMNMVESGDLAECAIGQKTFIIDSTADSFVIMARGSKLSVSITDTTWTTITLQPLFTDNSTWFWELPSTKLAAGEYLYSVHSAKPSTPCAYRFFAQSDFDFFLATTDEVDHDILIEEPAVGVPAHLVVQLNGFYGGFIHDPFRLFAELLVTTVDERDQLAPAFYSSGSWRSSCGFHLYFGIGDICRFEDQRFYATVFVDDDHGYAVQRTTVGYCRRGLIPPPTYGPTDCQNGGIPLNGTVCLCHAHFTGSRCQTIECQNGGTPAGDACRCPSGIEGIFCEIMTCSVKNEYAENSPNHKTFTMVLSTRKSMRGKVKALADQVDEFTRDYNSNSPLWFEFFTIVLVDQKNVSVMVADDALEFASNIKSISENFDNYTDEHNDDCPVQLNTGLRLALAHTYGYSNVHVFADSPSVDVNETQLLDLLDTADNLHASIFFFGLDSQMCDGSGTFGANDLRLVDWTDGQVIYTARPGQMLSYILTMYNSGLVSHRSSERCDLRPLDFYFPLDAQAMSFTIVASGQEPKIEVTPPRGAAADFDSTITDENRTSIHQYIAACESGWTTSSAYCYRMSEDNIGWLGGFLQCAAADKASFLVDVLTRQQYDFLRTYAQGNNIWLGLIKDTNTNEFYFYQPNGINIPLNTTFAKDFWAPDQDFTDPRLVRVYMNTTDGLWYMATLQEQHFYICQTLRYGKGFEPATMSSPLPAGFWRVKVSSQIDCDVVVRVQSSVQVYYGFVQDQHNDFVKPTANIDSVNNYVTATATGLGTFKEGATPEGRINYVILDSEERIDAREPRLRAMSRQPSNAVLGDVLPLPMVSRANCLYDAVSPAFLCPHRNKTYGDIENALYLKFSGIDQFGYPFERYAATRCDKYVTRCYNGGFAHNGACVCARHFAGTDCRSVLCENGGRPNPMTGSCSCSDSFSGQFCELAKCDPPYPASLPTDQRTLIIALETSFEMTTAIFFLKKNLSSLLRANAATHPRWFKNYVFLPFDTSENRDRWLPKIVSSNIDDIDRALHDIKLDELESSDSCPRPIASVLMDALRTEGVAMPDSVVVVITHSAVEDYSLSSELTPILLQAKAQVHFALIDAPSPCNLGWHNPAAEAVRTYATMTAGSVIAMVPLDLTTGFFGQFLPALYREQLVSVTVDVYKQDCAQAEFIFQIDHGTSSFVVAHTGADVRSFAVVGPAGHNLTLPSRIFESSADYITIFEIDKGEVRPGTYIVRSSSDGSVCTLAVRASSSILVNPGYVQIQDSFNGASQDDAHFAPLDGDKNLLVVQVAGLGAGRLEIVQIISPDDSAELVASLFKRDAKCGYTFYADASFECNYKTYEVIIFGVDDHGQQFHRNFVTKCVSNRPAPPPPSPSCDVGTIKADITFVLDTSKSLVSSGFTLSQMKLFILRVTLLHSLDAQHVQVGVMTLSDEAERGGFFNFRQSSDSDIYALLSKLTVDGGGGQNITLGMEALRRDMFTKESGYRADPAVRHHIVYVTASTSPTDVDPANAVLALQSEKISGFSIVALNISNPSDRLLSLASPACRYFAQDDISLMPEASNFVNNLLCSPQRPCGM